MAASLLHNCVLIPDLATVHTLLPTLLRLFLFLPARTEAHFTLSNLESVYDASDVFDGAVAEIGKSLCSLVVVDCSSVWEVVPRCCCRCLHPAQVLTCSRKHGS